MDAWRDREYPCQPCTSAEKTVRIAIELLACSNPTFVGNSSLERRCPHTSVLIVTDIRSRFFVSIIPLVYFFIQHKVHRIPGGNAHISLPLD